MISVCMATYNGEKYIEAQLISILSQIDKNDEVIISDDSSTDKTIEIIKSFNDSRIKIYDNQKFKSPTFNFENALKHATGDYMFLSDQDDIWVENKVEMIINALEENDLVLSDATIIDEHGKQIGDFFYAINGSRKGFVKNIVKNSYLGCSMAFNRKVLDKALPFPKDIPMHDWWLGLVAEIYGKTYFIKEPLIRYRRHGNNASPTGEKSHYSFSQKIGFRIPMLKSLFLRYMNVK